MRTAGIVGGIGPESTIAYYRLIVEGYRERVPDGSYPPVVINSIDLTKMLALISAGQLAEVIEYLLEAIRRLGRAGADFGLLAANTPHVVFEALRAQSPIPLISIVEVTREAATAQGLKRLGLFGTRFTMQGRFFHDGVAGSGITLVAPASAEQDFIHEKYMNELVNGVVLGSTRDGLVAIVERLKQEEEIDGVILGGTELSPILGDVAHEGVTFLDTTRLHVNRVVDLLVS